MDPITHGMVGLAIATISGEPILGAVSLGTTLGAMAPDLDIVMQSKGHYAYLKNHRGMSHSLPFLAGIAGIISTVIHFIFPATAFGQILLWTFMGTLSHTLLDILNSYGAQIFWPLSKKRFSGSLLLVYDPMVIILSLYLIFSKEPKTLLSMKVGLIFVIYLFIRIIMKNRIYDKIIDKFGKDIHIMRVNLLPSMIGMHKWHFIIDSQEKSIVGEINIFNNKLKILKELEKKEIPFMDEITNSAIGKFFQSFTPIYHIDIQKKNGYYYVTFTDLRYFIKDDFLHHATAILSGELELLEGLFHPYSLNQSVSVI
ncbi:metal-dependent hydrolase [Irregularibacter muris]|uniref:Metal-dependent hydrolase n=1 Tax=Irregularibacter muris TaxID=1796619 RepID=A0AAE3L0G1_9FIRM|nr:metal-dependent hydrolase [Irregularibacter muris]MCR1899867.1 metal-dependent hydrolase [Irregularibacter muris]